MMKATILDLRRNTRKILDAIERNESVSLTRRGREIALIVPNQRGKKHSPIRQTSAFGMWKDRSEMKNPAVFVRRMRQGRFHDI